MILDYGIKVIPYKNEGALTIGTITGMVSADLVNNVNTISNLIIIFVN